MKFATTHQTRATTTAFKCFGCGETSHTRMGAWENKKGLFISSNEVVGKKYSMIEGESQLNNNMAKTKEYNPLDLYPFIVRALAWFHKALWWLV